MSKAKVTSGFSTNNYSDSDLHVKAGTIADKLSVNRPFNATYCIQVAGVGADPKRVWSDEIATYVI